MGGLAPGQLKSRRGSHSSPRRLHYRFIFFDRDSETHCGKNSYQLCGTSAFSSPSPCGSLALNGPPDWPSPSPPPTVPVVLPPIPQLPSEKVAQLQHSQEFVKEVDAAKMCQTLVVTGDGDISRRIFHSANF